MLILKSIFIGIGKIIPGVSGSMIAIAMGIYDNIIDSINNFFKNIKKNSIFLSKIAIGIVTAIILFSNLISICLDKYYIITMFFFIGLIMGSMDDIKVNIKKENNYIVLITFILVTFLGFINIDNNVIIENNFIHFIYYIFVGFVDAVTMVVPGISGTATLMMIGAYNTLIKTYSNIFDFNLLMYHVRILLPFFIGMIIGIIITAKIIDYLFKYYKDKTYSAILGFSLSTILLMIIRCINNMYTISTLLIAIISLFIGVFLIKKINHYIND